MNAVNFKKLDIDYAKKLTDKQRRWLYKFLLEYNFGVFGDNPLNETKEQQSGINRARKSYQKDIYYKGRKGSLSLENQEKEVTIHGRKKAPRSVK